MTTDLKTLRSLLGDRAPQDDALLTRVADLLMRSVIVEAMSRMNEKTLDAFDALLDNNASSHEIALYLKEHVPGIENIVHAELTRLSSLEVA